MASENKRSINTRTRYKIVGSDYSAQEPRLTAFLSGEPKMYEAYTQGKDLYAIIAQSAFDNKYEDNLEFYQENTVLELDGKKIVAGSGKEFIVKTDEQDTITVNYYEILETVEGDKSANEISINDRIISDIGNLTVVDKVQNNNKITFKFSL